MKKNIFMSLVLITGLFNSNYSHAQAKASQKAQSATQKLINNAKSAVANVTPTSKHSIGLGLGETFLMSGFSDEGKDKITLDFYYAYRASYSFDLLINLHTSAHDNGTKDVDLFGLTSSIKSKFFDFDAFAPYILGGLGFYQPTTTRDLSGVLTESDPEFTFGFNLGIGVDLRLNNRVTIGLLGHFHKPFDVEQDDQKDVNGHYFKLLLTSMYSF
jgi:opacity protein-like surface antigen